MFDLNNIRGTERNGARRAVGYEWGKHDEVSGFAGGRNKGESVGWNASGIWRHIGNRDGFQKQRWSAPKLRGRDCHTVFVDKLPENMTKRDIYKGFGKCGSITDVFLSRKVRKNANGPFAFVRFYSLKGAMRAVSLINETSWDGLKLHATMSRFRREGEAKWIAQRNMKKPGWIQRTVKKWVAVKSKDRSESRVVMKDKQADAAITKKFARGECEADRIQKEMLQWRMYSCYPCSTKLDHIGRFFGVSREGYRLRSWGYQEVYGTMRVDDKMKESKSYSTVRILLDYFQWERIHEWVSLRIDDRVFEVFVKEFGSEVYSVQSHPDLGTESSVSMAELNSPSLAEESQTVLERSPAATTNVNLNFW
ncbi:hypothetical protein PIB30_050710 [Stylosanthes scabra]|uniref:RRM domain-containing protein n=1 Tax=Stylosanthes scabra TaxID=79078 RepID=A0ABU6VGU9_9FABA|nr:hypothetical protein [Stylosanthes scabra]